MTDRNNNHHLTDANPDSSAAVTAQAQNAQGDLRQLLPKAHPLSWWMLVITTLAILTNSIDRIILPTLLPAIMKEFNLTEMQAGWLNFLSFFGTLSGAVIFDIFSDYIGTGYKRCYSWSVAVLVEAIAGVATAFCKTLGVFQALRVAMGMGTSGSEPALLNKSELAVRIAPATQPVMRSEGCPAYPTASSSSAL